MTEHTTAKRAVNEGICKYSPITSLMGGTNRRQPDDQTNPGATSTPAGVCRRAHKQFIFVLGLPTIKFIIKFTVLRGSLKLQNNLIKACVCLRRL
ncbi:hypothetical protein BaRGS_00004288 [Batillaria attramentaria]|uniref:Uncharacterized protein n=1 Tax=Batillaria attramentaria TaxID=370345 RepID=A0ABD0LY50_9CAEN